MKSKENWTVVLQELRTDSAVKQKRGINFIISSVFLWAIIFCVHNMNLPIMTKNLYTFCCSALLFPLAVLFSKLLKIDFQNKENPLTNLGILLSLNQMLYILIAMWIYAAMPDKMVMVYAMIFGAHLLPFGWLYQSKAYYFFAVFITVFVLLTGVFNQKCKID